MIYQTAQFKCQGQQYKKSREKTQSYIKSSCYIDQSQEIIKWMDWKQLIDYYKTGQSILIN